MNYASITYVLGTLLLVTGSSMVFPLIFSLYYNEGDFEAIAISAVVTILIGLPLWWFFRKNHELNIKDGFFIAVFGWMLVSAVSALPFMIHGSIPSFTDAFFEMMSGYTTSGATILTDIEAVPHGLLFWRSETHLLGGMGFLTLTVIFLPHGMGGLRIFRAESSPGPGHYQGKISAPQPGHHDLAVGHLSGAEPAGNCSCCASAACRFSIPCAMPSARYPPPVIPPRTPASDIITTPTFDWVIIVFMFLGGMTFMLFYQMLKGNWQATENQYRIPLVCGISAVFLRDGVAGFCGRTTPMPAWRMPYATPPSRSCPS